MKEWLSQLIAKYIILVISIMLGSSLYLAKLAHTHAAGFDLKNQAEARLYERMSKNRLAISEAALTLKLDRTSRTQVSIALASDKENPNLVRQNEELSAQINDLIELLRVLRLEATNLERQKIELLGS